MIGYVLFTVSFLLSTTFVHVAGSDVSVGRECFSKGEMITAKFEGISGTGVWIGLYERNRISNFTDLPKESEALSSWVLSCGETIDCVWWPSKGEVHFPTDDLDYGDYVAVVSGDGAGMNAQAHSEKFTIGTNCVTATVPTTDQGIAPGENVQRSACPFVNAMANGKSVDSFDMAEGMELYHRWIAPDENDERSPCPFVNAMANHGFVNRDGKSVDLFDMAHKMELLYNVAAEYLREGPIQKAIDCNQTYVDENGIVRIDLDTLFDNNCEEHQASMVRPDSFYGLDKSKEVNDNLLNNLMKMNPSKDYLTTEDVMHYQGDRIMESRLKNPETEFSDSDVDSMGSEGLFLFLLGDDPSMTTIDKSRLFLFLLMERLPHDFIPQQLRDTPFNPMDETDTFHDKLMQSKENVESMVHLPMDKIEYLHSLHSK